VRKLINSESVASCHAISPLALLFRDVLRRFLISKQGYLKSKLFQLFLRRRKAKLNLIVNAKAYLDDKKQITAWIYPDRLCSTQQKTGLKSPVFKANATTKRLNVKQEVHYVAVFTDVGFTFNAQFACFFGAGFTVTGDKVVE